MSHLHFPPRRRSTTPRSAPPNRPNRPMAMLGANAAGERATVEIPIPDPKTVARW
jgi:hypothetical protein